MEGRTQALAASIELKSKSRLINREYHQQPLKHGQNQSQNTSMIDRPLSSPTQPYSDGDGDGESASINRRLRPLQLDESIRLPSGARTNKRTLDEQATPWQSDELRPAKQHVPNKTESRPNSPSESLQPARSTIHQTNLAQLITSPTQASQEPMTENFIESSEPKKRRLSESTQSSVTSSEPYLKQPATRPISEPQLINEVKGIYAGLVMVEKKCVEIVTQQSQSTKRLEDQQWKALVALHRTLLQEHHDFFSASQHPTASDALKKLAVKYAMPARMWRHGIHAFLELLRHRLPGSMEHMLSFIYLSYSMMALLKESVPTFVETWIECLGDLARYRMAIEDSDPRDREIWSNVARMWYNEAADKSPNVGRIQHHLAVLARPNIVEQLFYYTKALTSLVPFINARESIMLLFDLFLKTNDAMRTRYTATESAFVHAFAILFVKQSVADFYAVREPFRSTFAAHIDRIGPGFKVAGLQFALALISGLLDFGLDDSQLWNLFRQNAETIQARKQRLADPNKMTPALELQIKKDIQTAEFDMLKSSSKVDRAPAPPAPGHPGKIPNSDAVVALAGLLFTDAVSVCASKIGDKNIVPFMHAILANLYGFSFVPGALPFIEAYVPWTMITEFLNTLGRSGISYCNVESEAFPPSQGGSGKQLPDDFHLRGFITTQYYYPGDFWLGQLVDDDERNVELPSHQAPRAERCLWLGVRLASLNRYLEYDYDTKDFKCTTFAEKLTPF